MACFERFIRFLTRNAYIQIALTGKSFCFAAKDAFETVFANTMRFTLVNGIGGSLILVGKLFISCATTFAGYELIMNISSIKSNIISFVLPCIV